LIVEHDDSMGTFATRVLRRAGFETAHVETGVQALTTLGEDRWDGVLTDAQLPDMSGMDLSAELRESHPHLVIAVIAGYHTAASDQVLKKCGADALLVRPLTPTGLAARMQELFAYGDNPGYADGAR
jgi:DNA-binding response OmpR family regulator